MLRYCAPEVGISWLPWLRRGLELCADLINIFKKREILGREPLPPSHSAVLATLFCHIHQNSFAELLHINNLTKEVNRLLAQSGERVHLKPRKVGAILDTLGFSERQRRNTGWTVLLWRADQERIHDLVEIHGIDGIGLSSIKVDLSACLMCQGMPQTTANGNGSE